MNGNRTLNDFGGLDRRQDAGDRWAVFLRADPSQRIFVTSKSWFEARAVGIIHFHGDYSSVDAVLATEEESQK